MDCDLLSRLVDIMVTDRLGHRRPLTLFAAPTARWVGIRSVAGRDVINEAWSDAIRYRVVNSEMSIVCDVGGALSVNGSS
jgi:hypothetical protein